MSIEQNLREDTMITNDLGYDYLGRVARARQLMREQDVDALYVTAGPTMTYFTGFSAYSGGWPLWLSVIFVPQSGEPTFILSDMHADILEAKGGSWVKDVQRYMDGDDPSSLLKNVLQRHGVLNGTVGVEDNLWFGDHELIHSVAPHVHLRSAHPLVNRLRMVKDAGEIDALRKASRICDAGFEAAIQAIREGRPEYEAALAINNAMLADGNEGMGVGGHFRTLETRLFQKGDIVDVDHGATYRGYHSDTARNVFVGQPTAEEERMYRVTVECFDRTMEIIKPGVLAEEVHRFAEAFMERHGLRQVWKIGHGVGLNHGHEAPYLQAGATFPLEEGMVFTIDPGCFVSGKYKDTPIHVEDVVVVTDSSVETLTHFTKDMVVV